MLRNLLDIAAGAGRRANAAAIRSIGAGGVDSWNWERLGSAIDGAAARLHAAGIGPGAAVALLAPNSPGWVAAYFAIARLGAVAVPIDAGFSDAEAARLLAAAECRGCVTVTARAAALPKLKGLAALRCFEVAELASPAPGMPLPPAIPIEPERTASYLFTSGTTGTPKIVPLTHRNLVHCVAAVRAEGFIRDGDVVLLPLPLHHIYPFTVGLMSTLASGGTVVFPEGLSGPQLFEALQRARPHILIGVPRLYEVLVQAVEGRVQGRGPRAVFGALLWLSQRLRFGSGSGPGRLLFRALQRQFGGRLRILACGGARLDERTWERLEAFGFEVLTGYGLTETSPLISFSPRGRARRGTEGVAIAGVEIRIEPRAGEELGEILVRGPNVFAGYRNNPEKNRAAFSDGWFRTGDLGTLDADGYLRVAGRADELIVLPDGKKLFPERVERVYQQSPLIRELGLLVHEGRLVAVVVPDLEAVRARGAARLRALINEQIELAGQRLARYERVAGTVIVASPLPRTRLGKLRRHLLAGIYGAALSGAAAAPPAAAEATPPPAGANAIEQKLWHWLAQRFPGKRLAPEASLQLDFGIDSVDWIHLTLELQQALGVRLTDELMSRVITVQDLMQAVSAAAQAPAAIDAVAAAERRWLAPRNAVLTAACRCVQLCTRMIMRAGFDVRADGLEHLPAGGPLIIASNHLSFLDPFALMAVLPWPALRRTWWAAWVGHMFRSAPRRLASRIMHAIPVDPDRGAAAGLALAREILEAGEWLVWFPEGQRSASGRLLPFTPGIGILVAQTGVPVLPLWISGSYEAWPRGAPRPRRHPIRIHVGTALTREQLDAAGTGHSAEARITDALRSKVAELGGGEA